MDRHPGLRTCGPGAQLRRCWPLPLLLAILMTAAAPAADAAGATIPPDDRGLPQWIARTWDDFPVRIELPDVEALDALLDRVPVASFDRDQLRWLRSGPKSSRLAWEPRVTPREAAALDAAGIRYERLPDRERAGRTAMEAAWASQAATGGRAFTTGVLGTYHTHAQIGALLAQAAADHPAIASTYSLGNSVQGRALFAIVISDNVSVEEAEPEVRLTSTIHGDEPVQLENLLQLVEELTTLYGSDSVITDLVDNTEIHIVPCLNPDGLAAGQRTNAHSVDLNRNFPVPDGSIGGDGTYTEELETQLIKAHGAAHDFALSLVGHGGALVVNYLWDYTYTLAPDDAALQLMALEYSQYNPPMYASLEFPLGITNGAAWYIAKGSVQDWAYHETGCWDFTVEVGDEKIPLASELDQLWLDNRQSLLHFIRAARYGVRGRVTASGTGLPLAAAVTVTGIAKSASTDPLWGDYVKFLPGGTHEIAYSSPGYTTRIESGVSTSWGTGTTLDVQLDLAAQGEVTGVVRDRLERGLAATVEARTYPLDELRATAACNADSGGSYSLDLEYGEYTFVAACAGHASVSRRVTLGSAAQSEDFTLPAVEELTLLAVNFEAGLGGWSGGWGLTTTQAHSPTHSLADTPTGNYSSNATNIVALSPGLDLSDALSANITFWARWVLEADYDAVTFEISTDAGVTWTAQGAPDTQPASGLGAQTPAGTPVFEGTQSAWVQETVSLSAYLGQPDVRCRFRLRSDVSLQYDGFYCDDFQLQVQRQSTTNLVRGPQPPLQLVAAPNPFNPATILSFTISSPGPVRLVIYDASGRRVRTLRDRALPAGEQRLRWDGCDDRGAAVASGTYTARLVAAGEARSVKLVLVK